MIDRKSAPSFSPDYSIQLPSVKAVEIAKGVEVLCFDQVKQALIKIDIIYKAGKWEETSPGLSHFTSHLLEKGTVNRNSFEIAEILDQYGAHLEISPGYDYTSLSLYILSNKIKEVFPLFIEILRSPSFPDNELALMKNIYIQNLKVNNEKNSYVASKLIRKNIFGKTHAYGSYVEEANVHKLNLENIKKFFAEHFTPCEIYLTGQFDDSTKDYILNQLKKIDYKKKSTDEFNHTPNPGSHYDYLERKESIQTSVRLGKRTINKNHPDYFHLLLLNHILGGYFGSRLMKNIREEKGLSYGIHSSINSFVHDSFFVISADVNKSNQDIAVQEIQSELTKLCKEAIPDQELQTAKNHLLGSIQLDMANPFSVVEKIKNIRLNQLDPLHYQNLFERIKKTSSGDLIQIANKYLLTEDLFIAKVG